MTPASIEGYRAMVETARVAARLPPETKESGTDLWAYEYAQDVAALLEEIERLRGQRA